MNKEWTLIPKEIPVSWESVFSSCAKDLERIESVIRQDMKKNNYEEFYPTTENIYRSLKLTKLQDIKVVLVGTFPAADFCSCGLHPRYTGLAYSYEPCDKIGQMSKNIYTEVCDNLELTGRLMTPDFSPWASRGVLMLNFCLTTRPMEHGSHGKIWMGFIETIFKEIDKINPKCIYLLWGREAEDLQSLLTNSAVKLCTTSPSGFSAARGFFGCGHFKEINRILKSRGIEEIDFSL